MIVFHVGIKFVSTRRQRHKLHIDMAVAKQHTLAYKQCNLKAKQSEFRYNYINKT